jgi:hypothetical protein
MSTRISGLALALLVFAVQPGCNSDDEAVFSQGDNLEGKPKATLLGELEGAIGTNGDGSPKEPEVVASVRYKAKITSNSGASICSGEIGIDILSDFNMKFPNAFLDCVSLRIDLGGILGAQQAAAGSQATGQGKISHDGQVLAMESIANATFAPPRPLLVGPIVQQEDKYKGFKRTSEHTMTYTNDAGESAEATGSFDIKVINHQTTFKYEGNEFDKVMHWEMTSNFDAPAKHGLTFKKWTWFWNTRPIMIPGFVIEGSLGDFIEGDSAEMAEALTGVLKIELYVKEYDMK